MLDADAGGSKFIAARKTYWDPLVGPPPVCDGTWDMCVVQVINWQTVLSAYAWLAAGQCCFTSVVIDSITEIQRKCKDNLVGTEQMKIADWGTLLTQMDRVIRDYRDLTLIPQTNVRVAVFIAETRMNKAGKYVPTMQGQIADSLAYRVDICGYLYVERTVDANGQPNGGLMRRLLITPNDMFEAGERVQGRLGTVVDDPRIDAMMPIIYPELNNQQQGAVTQ